MIEIDRNITVVNTIADRLKAAREAAGLTQEQLAAKARVSQGTIGNIEGGTRQNPRELLAIAEACGVSATWLKTGKGPRQIDGNHQASTSTGPTIDEALVRIGLELARDLPEFVRDDLADEMAKWVRRKGVEHNRQRVAQLLGQAAAAQAEPRKRTGTS